MKPSILYGIKLSDIEQQLLEYFMEHGVDVDVPIVDLYEFIKDVNSNGIKYDRTMQQYVGSFVSRLNRKLLGWRITPGKLKRTYRISNA